MPHILLFNLPILKIKDVVQKWMEGNLKNKKMLFHLDRLLIQFVILPGYHGIVLMLI